MAEVKSRATPLVEQGDIYFLYRPRVTEHTADVLKDRGAPPESARRSLFQGQWA